MILDSLGFLAQLLAAYLPNVSIPKQQALTRVSFLLSSSIDWSKTTRSRADTSEKRALLQSRKHYPEFHVRPLWPPFKDNHLALTTPGSNFSKSLTLCCVYATRIDPISARHASISLLPPLLSFPKLNDSVILCLGGPPAGPGSSSSCWRFNGMVTILLRND